MPEGHTVHRIANDHRKRFLNEAIQSSSPQGRFSDEAEEVNGRRLVSVDAHGKHLAYQFEGDLYIHIHLGLYGKFQHWKIAPEPRGQIRWRVIGNNAGFDLRGPNQCELFDEESWVRLRDRLGPDPLRDDANPELAWKRISRSRSPIGTLLLNQSVISGVGNIYRSEVLFLLGIHPNSPGKTLGRAQFDRLWDEMTRLMRIGVRYNRIVIASPEDVGKPRSRMTRDETLVVYKKENCSTCGSGIASWELGNRRVFACAHCQREDLMVTATRSSSEDND